MTSTLSEREKLARQIVKELQVDRFACYAVVVPSHRQGEIMIWAWADGHDPDLMTMALQDLIKEKGWSGVSGRAISDRNFFQRQFYDTLAEYHAPQRAGYRAPSLGP